MQKFDPKVKTFAKTLAIHTKPILQRLQNTKKVRFLEIVQEADVNFSNYMISFRHHIRVMKHNASLFQVPKMVVNQGRNHVQFTRARK